MALDQSALLTLLSEVLHAEGSAMAVMLQRMLQELVDAEAAAVIGAGMHERTPARRTQRNGTRPKTVTTGVGDVEVKIPKTRTGSFFPALLEPRRRIDKALHAVIMQAYVEGVSTRRVDDLVTAMGGTGISKSEVSRICAALDAEVGAWRTRDLGGVEYPYVFLDATYCKSRVGGHVVSQAVVVATAVTANGHREVLGIAVGDSETEVFWTEFLRSLKDRGLTGVRLVSSDAHAGLKAAICTVFQGATWQRCSVHFMRNLLAKAGRDGDMLVAWVRTIFSASNPAAVTAQLDHVAHSLHASMPEVCDMLQDAKADITAFTAFPRAHWRKIWSTNPIERLNKEIKRRTNVVGIFPNKGLLQERLTLHLRDEVLLEGCRCA
ncbi:IS256 family transposase [Cellulosimicrobium sp. TH-20]|uniref:IS256 family transposase n=1 Tax=Cellulosimicrobium sp. TH-20 TaxID=1980001 RepID=UPI001581FC42